MVCIIRSKYQNELKQLSGILGGEKAAHYALCMNNGYNLTDTKEGKHSKLFDQLKEKYGEDEAIRMKTYTFTPQFADGSETGIISLQKIQMKTESQRFNLQRNSTTNSIRKILRNQ